MIQKQVKWTNNGEWDKLLQTCKPSLRANHTVASLKSEMESLATLGVSKIGVKDISVREEGDVAYASHAVTGDGEEFGTTESVYRKIDGVWYDDEC